MKRLRVEDPRENDGTDVGEKSPIVDVSVFVFGFDSDAVLLRYLIYAERAERLHLHQWKVKNSTLPAGISIVIEVSTRDG